MYGLLHDEYLSALAKVTEGATGGPWHIRDAATRGRNLSTQTGMLLSIEQVPGTLYQVAAMSIEDAAFIAAARDAVPRLMAENRRLRTLLSLNDKEQLDGTE